MSEWLKTEPLRDGSSFIADIGLPFAVIAAWSGCHQEYVYAMLQIDMFNGELNDVYFENEFEHRTQVRAWMPLPEINP